MTYTLYFLKSRGGRRPYDMDFYAEDDQTARQYAEALCEESGFVLINVFTEDHKPLYEPTR